MWALRFWPDGFLPIWVDEVGADRIMFDLGVSFGPAWLFSKGSLIEYSVSYWRWTTVKR